jgi:hypothetical protein
MLARAATGGGGEEKDGNEAAFLQRKAGTKSTVVGQNKDVEWRQQRQEAEPSTITRDAPKDLNNCGYRYTCKFGRALPGLGLTHGTTGRNDGLWQRPALASGEAIGLHLRRFHGQSKKKQVNINSNHWSKNLLKFRVRSKNICVHKVHKIVSQALFIAGTPSTKQMMQEALLS